LGRDLTELTRIIRRIEAKARASSPAASPPRARATIEDLLEGAIEETERGRLLVVRRRFPVDHRHGAQSLLAARDAASPALALLARAGAAPTEGRRLLYLDTETTGLAGGTGTYAFLVGVGFFDGDDFEVRQFFMRDLDEEPALLCALETMFRRFDGFVTYNGGGFDLPLLETRFVLGRRRFPGEEVFHVDLLGAARRLWSARLADCRLGTVEQHALRFAREHDLPGALIPTVYFEYLRRKQPHALPRVFEHNRHDILSLAALTGWIADAVTRAPVPDLEPEALAGLGRLLEASEPVRSLACYRMALDAGLPTPSRERLLLRLAQGEKRRERWDEARALWEAAARGPRDFDPRPWEEIAKVHEHRRRDLAAARLVVEQALDLARRHRASERVLAAFEHRRERLARRLERAGGLDSARQPA
jgi:uncharacterized protein